jgi:DNA invertase Pin-like site-specific DNA recombinase
MKKALIYKRVSTDEQASDDRHSLTTQQKLCEQAIIEGEEYVLADNGIFDDPGKTATNMNRPGLQDLLTRIQEDKTIGAVFVQDTDRLARNAGDHLVIKALLRKHDVKLISVSQPGLEDTPEGNFMDLVIAGVNQFQSQITSRKTLKSLEQKFKDGGWPTHAPLGYLNVGSEHDEKKRTVIVDPVRGPLVTEAFKMYATGDYSILEVRDQITKAGFRSSTGKLLAHSKMVEMLKNHFYYGEMRWRGLIGTGKHEPLIDKSLYDRCQAVMNEHNGHRCRRRKHNFVLRGFVYCGICSYRYTAEHKPSKNKSYYHCSKQGNKVFGAKIICNADYVEVKDLENQVQQHFNQIQFSEDLIAKAEYKLKDAYEAKRSSVSESKSRLEKAKLALEHKLETAEEKLIEGVLDDEQFSRIKKRCREQIAGVEDHISHLERSRNLKVDVIQKVLAMIRNVGHSYERAEPELKRLYLGLFWSKFEVTSKKITLAEKSPILRAIEAVRELPAQELNTPSTTEWSIKSDLAESVRLRTFRGG